ncbi:ABC transporter ATP-binding protein [Arsenicitalea aurantiaca]|uniref:Glutathione import ATP-binding protein GsiA n=1 Tax=Arsenicitalea aurantiaca TaxID=1783274 RepID=A0A433XAN2_9HYPH|nr:ABC transporter ATP-binding protein [Arsenicitalea aurantiaca]RUT31090.1 ABC transporter ATP-binding protein [Arsenicitalea aurantiaca]
MMNPSDPLLSVRDLSVTFANDAGTLTAVDGLGFSVAPGECLAIVGESGSGKSVTAMSILGLTRFNGGTLTSGAIRFRRRNGETLDLARADEPTLRTVRGNEIAMIFQEPMTALNPVYPIGEQIAEAIRAHRPVSREAANAEALALIEKVRIPEPERRFGQYPHELSGGMRQRIVIAMALACRPSLLIADEPTTALDVTIQAQILYLVRSLARGNGMAMLFITHDMGVVAEIADRVLVMRHGRKVEEAAVGPFFSAPEESYSQALLAAVPRLGSAPAPETVPQTPTPLLEVRNLVTRFPVRRGILGRHVANVHAVEDVSLTISRGETLALVGESGCGKSTTGRSIVRLVDPLSGSVALEGEDVLGLDEARLRRRRRDMQIIFQDPYAALDPRQTAFEQIADPMLIHGMERGSALRDRVVSLLRRVGLGEEHMSRYPHEFSGGQRQRLCIARALGLSPKLIVADEAVSALDVSIQKQVVELLQQLQAELGISYLFISHDMGVVERMSHRVAVMYMGRVVEIGPRASVFGNPRHPYTRALLAAVPTPDPANRRREAPPVVALRSPIHPIGYAAPAARYDDFGDGHLVLAS